MNTTTNIDEFAHWTADLFGVSWKRWTSTSTEPALVNQRSAAIVAAIRLLPDFGNKRKIAKAFGMSPSTCTRALMSALKSESMSAAADIIAAKWEALKPESH